MNDVLYVIGPSSVGKSTLARSAAKQLSASVFDSDDQLDPASRPWRWPLVLREIKRAEAQGGRMLLVIGAGAQADATAELAGYLKVRRARTVLIVAGPKEVWERNERTHGLGRSLLAYTRHEYWDRACVYRAANHLLDVSGLDTEGASDAFLRLARQMVAGSAHGSS